MRAPVGYDLTPCFGRFRGYHAHVDTAGRNVLGLSRPYRHCRVGIATRGRESKRCIGAILGAGNMRIPMVVLMVVLMVVRPQIIPPAIPPAYGLLEKAQWKIGSRAAHPVHRLLRRAPLAAGCWATAAADSSRARGMPLLAFVAGAAAGLRATSAPRCRASSLTAGRFPIASRVRPTPSCCRRVSGSAPAAA